MSSKRERIWWLGDCRRESRRRVVECDLYDCMMYFEDDGRGSELSGR